MVRGQAVSWLLRLSVAFAFLYAGVDAFFEPYAWLDYFPQFLLSLGNSLVLLHAFGVVEILLGLWLLWGRWVRYPAVIMAILLIAIVALNTAAFQLLFRDISIALAALALAALPEYKEPAV